MRIKLIDSSELSAKGEKVIQKLFNNFSKPTKMNSYINIS